MFDIIVPASPAHFDDLRGLFREYAAELGVDLCFQGFERELAELPGDYAPPDGRALLATHDSRLAGCVALRRTGPGTCEMKRLYVRATFRRLGLGRVLATKIISAAREAGYARIRLDTLATLRPAIAMYRALGFVEVEPYYDNPLTDVVFLELTLLDQR